MNQNRSLKFPSFRRRRREESLTTSVIRSHTLIQILARVSLPRLLRLLKFVAITIATGILILIVTTGCKRNEGRATQTPKPIAVAETTPASPAPLPSLAPSTNTPLPPIAGPLNPLNPASRDYRLVRVFYATDRNLVRGRNPLEIYKGGRGDVTYGACLASIPHPHENKTGKPESPAFLKVDLPPAFLKVQYQYQFRADPATHVVLMDVRQMTESNYFDALRFRIHESASKSAFLFVHGYNVTFEDAARRTAEISYELSFDGAPVFFSWPSQGTLVGYPTDEANVEWSEIDLEQFLEDFAAGSDAQNIYLIGHSMGNRALTLAFAALLRLKPDVRARFKQLILTAPDIDADVFRREIAPLILSTNNCPLVTLYASSTDQALKLSKQFHSCQRLGDTDPSPIVLPNMDTIDVSAVDSSFTYLGHSYAFIEPSVLSDIFNLIRNSAPLSQKPRFKLTQVGVPPDQYWQYRP